MALYQNVIKKKDQKLGEQPLPFDCVRVDSIACKSGLEDFNLYHVNVQALIFKMTSYILHDL